MLKMNCCVCFCWTSPREFVKPMSLVMDDRGSLPHPRSSGLRYVHLSSGLSAVKSVHLLLPVRAEPRASSWKLKGHCVCVFLVKKFKLGMLVFAILMR